MRYHLTSVRMAIKEKTRNNRCWRGYRGKRTLIQLLMSLHFGAAPMGKNMEIPQKIKNRAIIWPSCSTSGYLSKEFCAVPPACTAHLTAAPSKAAEAHPVAQRPPAPLVWQAHWGLSSKGTKGPRVLERGRPGRVPEPGPNLERDSWDAKLWQGAPCVLCNHWCIAPSGRQRRSRPLPPRSLHLSRWCSGKESACQHRRCQRCGFDPWAGKIPWSRKWQPAPVSLLGNFHRQRSLEAIVHGVTKSQTWLNTQQLNHSTETCQR